MVGERIRAGLGWCEVRLEVVLHHLLCVGDGGEGNVRVASRTPAPALRDGTTT